MAVNAPELGQDGPATLVAWLQFVADLVARHIRHPDHFGVFVVVREVGQRAFTERNPGVIDRQSSLVRDRNQRLVVDSDHI